MNDLRHRKVKKLAKGYKSIEQKSNEALKLTNPVGLKPEGSSVSPAETIAKGHEDLGL